MRNYILTASVFLLVFYSCNTQKESAGENSSNSELETMIVDTTSVSKEIEEVVIKDSTLKNSTMVSIDTSNVSKIDKVEPIKEVNPVVFANPLPGLSNRIDLLKLPTEDEVGISAYPNAHVIQLDDKSYYRGNFYVSMELVTSDSVGQVLEYYERADANWYHTDNNGIHTFKMEKDKYFRETNTLQVLPLNKILYEEVDSLLGRNASTLIRIYYEIDPEGKVYEQLGLADATPVNH